MRVSRSSRLAFTLVELLVVIGIIAVLISILLPVISGARRQSRLVQCSSNLRTLGQACQMHAQEHGGYYPLAGYLQANPFPGFANLPVALGDGWRKRYTYSRVPGSSAEMSITPLPGALASYLGVNNLNDLDTQALDQQLNDPDGVWRYFMCPDTNAMEKARLNSNPNDNTVVDQGTMMIISVNGSSGAWCTNSDYGLNEGIFGYHYQQEYARNRLAGNVARVRRSSEVALMTDAVRSKASVNIPGLPTDWPGWICWRPSLDGAGAATLGDAFAGNARATAPDSFDLKRHSGRMNVAFVDGHVATFVLKKEDLDGVYLVAP